jgi:hypothetical protein
MSSDAVGSGATELNAALASLGRRLINYMQSYGDYLQPERITFTSCDVSPEARQWD